MKSLSTKSFVFFHDDIKFFDCRFSIVLKVIITCEDKEFVKIHVSFMITRTAEQSGGHIEISDKKIFFIFIIENIIKLYAVCEAM